MQAYLKPPKKYDQHRSLARSDKMNEKENNKGMKTLTRITIKKICYFNWSY